MSDKIFERSHDMNEFELRQAKEVSKALAEMIQPLELTHEQIYYIRTAFVTALLQTERK